MNIPPNKIDVKRLLEVARRELAKSRTDLV